MSSELSEAIAAMLNERATTNREAFLRKQAARKADRAAKKIRRDAGLVQRHARKEAHLRAQAVQSSIPI